MPAPTRTPPPALCGAGAVHSSSAEATEGRECGGWLVPLRRRAGRLWRSLNLAVDKGPRGRGILSFPAPVLPSNLPSPRSEPGSALALARSSSVSEPNCRVLCGVMVKIWLTTAAFLSPYGILSRIIGLSSQTSFGLVRADSFTSPPRAHGIE